jgi:transglutaminase-like putative cysteine protease
MKRGTIRGIFLAVLLFTNAVFHNETWAKTVIPSTKATGEAVADNEQCVIDYSNCEDGYIVVHYKEKTKKSIMAQVTGPGGRTYTYTLRTGRDEVLPLTEGNGTYVITIFLNVEGNSYITVQSADIPVEIKDEFAPYIRPNQYVNYNKSTKVVKKAAKLTKNDKTDLAKVKKVYEYVIKNFKYDQKKAKTVKGGYLPNLDKIYKKKKGICFDYAAVMTAMLRSQGVPSKLIIGYTGNVYHAWINVYTKKRGWIAAAIYFDGKKWKRMDPTFASTGNSAKSVMKYIGNGKNYKAKYSY